MSLLFFVLELHCNVSFYTHTLLKGIALVKLIIFLQSRNWDNLWTISLNLTVAHFDSLE